MNGLSITNIEPKLDPNALKSIDCPEIKTVWATPGVFRVISCILFITASVRSDDAESGSCTFIIR